MTKFCDNKSVNSKKDTKSIIDRCGWKLCGVFGDRKHFPFMYTIGNYECSLPELLMIGSKNGGVLNCVCEIMRKRNRPFKDGELIDFGTNFPLKVLNGNDAARVYAWQVDAYYGTDKYTVQQIVIPDPAGKYPGDPQCVPPFCWVPILTGQSKLQTNGIPDFARINTI